MSTQEDIESAVDAMGSDRSEMASTVASQVHQIAIDESTETVPTVLGMLRGQLGLEGDDDQLIDGLVGFVDEHAPEGRGWDAYRHEIGLLD